MSERIRKSPAADEAELPAAWTAMNDKPTRGPRDAPKERLTAERLLRELDEVLEPFRLGEHTKRELREMAMLIYHRKTRTAARQVCAGYLLQCDFESLAAKLLTAVSRLLANYGLVTHGPIQHRFGEEIERLEDIAADHRCMVVITDSGDAPVVDSMAPSGVQSQMREQLAIWNHTWEQLRTYQLNCPENILVAVVPRAAVQNTWKKRDPLFFFAFPHHLYLDDLPAEDIVELFRARLHRWGIDTDEAFDAGIDAYIRTVYPKADLKYQDFLEDLQNRVTTLYYSASRLEGRLTERCIPFYRRPESFESIMRRLDDLPGMDEVRTAFEEIYYQSRGKKSRKTPLRLNMAFVGNPGTGKTTVARMTAELLYHMGLIKKNHLVSVAPADIISPWVGQTAQQAREACHSAYGGVLFIDEAYSLLVPSSHGGRQPGEQAIDVILQEMEDHADELVVIFAGYEDMIQKLLDSNAGLRSRIGRTIRFPDFTDEELERIFLRTCESEDFAVADGARGALRDCIAFSRSRKNFGNAREMENLFQTVRAQWQRGDAAERVLTVDHFRAVLPEPNDSGLDDLVGMKSIKEHLAELRRRTAYIAMAERSGLKIPKMNLHMLFTGNPGTGKTTVAKLAAQELYNAGALPTNRCLFVEAKDILSMRGGTPAERLGDYIKEAMGGVLFLDEAYALTEYASGNIGREVLAALLTEMERHQGELVVIFAGYERNMREFVQVNPGLASRIGLTFHFPDFTADELTEIFLRRMDGCGFSLGDGVAARAKRLMEYFCVIPDFGNARFVDRVVDRTITRRALRDSEDEGSCGQILAEDVPEVREMFENVSEGNWLIDPGDITDDMRYRTAIHELGHALVSLLLEPEREIIVNVLEAAYFYGYVEHKPRRRNPTESELKHRIAVCFGGRAAERLVYGEHDTGCAADFMNAKRIAEDMLERYAMGELGSHDIAPLLREGAETAETLLAPHVELLKSLAPMVREKGVVPGEEILAILREQTGEAPDPAEAPPAPPKKRRAPRKKASENDAPQT